MNVSREIKKKEAITRMKLLGLFDPCIKAFETRGEVQLTEPWGGLYEFKKNGELNVHIKLFEEEYNALVYHVIHSPMEFGDCYNFLYVSDHPEEWEYDILDLRQGFPMAYVWNKDVEYFSEFGAIGIKEKFGGLIRTN